eukprot:s43_g43.t1
MSNPIEILQVPQHATLDEIKFAFKRRALQVHPDKGGSKDAFHKVYQALEILSDPEARKKYDQRLMGAKEPQSKGKEKVPARRTPQQSQRDQEEKSSSGPSGKDHGAKPAHGSHKPGRIRLMMKIHFLLQQLPRNVRFEVISKDFSLKQRVLLQEWMVENAAETGSEKPPDDMDPDPVPSNSSGFSDVNSSQDTAASPHCRAVAIPIQFRPKAQAPVGKSKTKSKSWKRSSGTRGVSRSSGSLRYHANISVDGVKIFTRCCDLPTALEYLVILTSAKQRALDPTTSQGTFEDRLEQALKSSALEQGKGLDELKLRFIVTQSVGIFIGNMLVKAPCVRSLEDVWKLRKCMQPFHGWVKHCRGKYNIYDHFSPVELHAQWEQFQAAVAEMFQTVGADAAPCLQQIRASHQATDRLRRAHLQSWEKVHMALQDKKKSMPKCLRSRQPRSFQLDPVRDQLVTLRKLLGRWAQSLYSEDQERHQLQQKKRRQEILQQRKKAKEAARKEFLKRMRDPSLTMDDILGPKIELPQIFPWIDLMAQAEPHWKPWAGPGLRQRGDGDPVERPGRRAVPPREAAARGMHRGAETKLRGA